MKIISQNGIEPTCNINITDVDDLQIMDNSSYINGWYVRTKKKVLKKNIDCSVLAVFNSKEEAESEFKSIEESLRDGKQKYKIGGTSIWKGPENEFIKTPKAKSEKEFIKAPKIELEDDFIKAPKRKKKG